MTVTQPDFWSEVVPPHVPHSQTSAAAADAIRPHSEGQRERILAYLANYGPTSAEVLSNVLELPGDSIRPRLVELRKLQAVAEVGESLTKKGRRCTVYGVAS